MITKIEINEKGTFLKAKLIIISLVVVSLLFSCSETTQFTRGDYESNQNAPLFGTSTIEVYIDAVKRIYSDDPGMNSGIGFIAFEVNTFKGITSDESDRFREFAEAENKQYVDGGIKELTENGKYDTETMGLKNGVLIRIDDIYVNDGDTLKFSISKFRASLAAIGMTLEYVKVKDEWELVEVSNQWIS